MPEKEVHCTAFLQPEPAPFAALERSSSRVEGTNAQQSSSHCDDHWWISGMDRHKAGPLSQDVMSASPGETLPEPAVCRICRGLFEEHEQEGEYQTWLP